MNGRKQKECRHKNQGAANEKGPVIKCKRANKNVNMSLVACQAIINIIEGVANQQRDFLKSINKLENGQKKLTNEIFWNR